MTATAIRRCSNCQRENGTHASWCDRDSNMGKRDPDHDILNAAADVLGLFGNGQPSIKVHTDTRHHVKTCNVPEESAEKVNRLRDLLAQRGRFPKLP